MTATTEAGAMIELDDDLKARVEAAAAGAGVTADSFILEAIVDRLVVEEDAAFRRLAQERWAEFERTGLAISWEETKKWLEAKARGENPPWPEARKITL